MFDVGLSGSFRMVWLAEGWAHSLTLEFPAIQADNSLR